MLPYSGFNERDFMKELISKFDKVDLMFSPPKKLEKVYNIYKRSLPVGIDRPVMFNVEKDNADWLVTHYLKTKVYVDKKSDAKSLIYYDIVPVDATPEEMSPFYNQ